MTRNYVIALAAVGVLTAGTAMAGAAEKSAQLLAAAEYVNKNMADQCFIRQQPDLDPTMLTDVEYEIKYRYDYQAADEPDNVYHLYRLTCDFGAYNEVVVFLTDSDTGEEGKFTVLSFAEPQGKYDYTDDTETKLKSPPTIAGFNAGNVLINADYDAEAGMIRSAGKWRGLGDAWDAGEWTFKEGQFLLTKYTVDPIYEANLDGEPTKELTDENYVLFQVGN